MSDERPLGPRTELEQLEAALAAGAITPELFATLRAKLQPATPAASPPVARTPPAPEPELPSLLEMFGQAPSPAPPPASPPPAPPRLATPPPVAATPPRPTAAEDAAARQRIEEHLARMRQAPPTPSPPPPPPPTFYPEPPAPAFYPEPKPVPAVAPVAAPVAARPPGPPPRPPRPGQDSPAEGRTSASWLLILLLVAVVSGLAYYFTSSSHPDENLTSPAPPTEAPAAPLPAPVAKKPKKATPPRKYKTKTAHVAPKPTPVVADSDAVAEEEVASPSAPVAAPRSAPVAAPAPGRPLPAVPEAGDNEATTRVRAAMASYYADLNAPPLHASQHFAPQIERLYIKQNLTPEAVDAELGRSFFPDNQQAQARIEPGTLRVSDPATDGSRTATFTEQMRLYRPSLQKYQRLRTQVRVRFNAEYQIVYMRQEKLLSNTFEE